MKTRKDVKEGDTSRQRKWRKGEEAIIPKADRGKEKEGGGRKEEKGREDEGSVSDTRAKETQRGERTDEGRGERGGIIDLYEG